MKTLTTTILAFLTTLTLTAYASEPRPATRYYPAIPMQEALLLPPHKQNRNMCWPYEHVKGSVRLGFMEPSVTRIRESTRCSKAESVRYIEQMVRDGVVTKDGKGWERSPSRSFTNKE